MIWQLALTGMHASGAHVSLLIAVSATALLAAVVVGAMTAIALVVLVAPERRVEAIRAIPGVLSELLPWSVGDRSRRRRSRRRPRLPSGGH